MRRLSQSLAVFASILAGLILLGWMGLHKRPTAFPAFPHRSPRLETVPLPDGLPAPVQRFYRQIYGERVPVVETAVFTGRARMRVAGDEGTPWAVFDVEDVVYNADIREYVRAKGP